MLSCVAVQFARRDSNGCGDETVVEALLGSSEVRSVSGRPGAEGAPRSRSFPGAVVEDESFAVLVLDVLRGWAEGGATRRDCRNPSRLDSGS